MSRGVPRRRHHVAVPSLDLTYDADEEVLVRARPRLRLPQLRRPALRKVLRHRVADGVPVVVGAGLVVTLLAGTVWASSDSHGSADRTAAPAPAPGGVRDLAVAKRPAPARPTDVAPLGRLHTADLLVTLPHAVDSRLASQIRHLFMVDGVERVDVGTATVNGHKATVIGVDPSTFRSYTPKLTAGSDELWRSVARGDLTASFTMGNETRLPLGRDVPVKARTAKPMRIGAFASVGIGGVDAVISRGQATAIGLPHDRGLVVSAPKGDAVALRDKISALLPRGSHVEMLRVVVVVRDAGSYLTRAQIRTVLEAAASKIGRPYVWGATGPDTFDCSGLVGWAYRKAGVSLPRTTFQQWYAGPHVPLSDARPGDLLFWNYDPTAPGLPDHVALYAGNGMMIVAPHTGDVVRYKAVPTAHLMGVVRVDPAAAARVDGPRL
jgi:cell wall-associated NlpC family hydrolase